jgi:crossover junction endodeoxyribonuclease RuvC
MRVLGIDPGSVKMGYGCIDVAGPVLTYVDAGILSARASLDKYARLAEIGRDLEALLVELHPDAVALEAGFVKSQMGALTSGAARGVAAYIAVRRGIPVREYAPATVKKTATGYGAADKSQVAELVARQLGMKTIPGPDAGDALAIAICRARDLGPVMSTARLRRAG